MYHPLMPCYLNTALADAYALSEVLPSVAAKKVDKGGYLVLRPDSGDPKEAVLMVSERLSRAVEHAVNQSDIDRR